MSVVIPTLGRPSWRRCLTSVLTALREAAVPAEVLLVWQAAEEPPRPEDLGTVAPSVRVLDVPAISSSWSRNVGLASASGRYVAFLDDDEVADDRWVACLLDCFATNPDATAVFGAVLPLDDAGIPHCRFDGDRVERYSGAVPPWRVGTAGNMAFRRDRLVELGGLHLVYGIGAPAQSAEDAEVVHRLLRSGDVVCWTPDAVVLHPTKTEGERLDSRKPYAHGMGVLLRRSHEPRLVGAYAYKVARAWLVSVLRTRPRGRREAVLAAQGLLIGLRQPARTALPRLQVDRLPAQVRTALAVERLQPVPSNPTFRPHLVFRDDHLVLHLHVGGGDDVANGYALRERLRLAGLPGVPELLMCALHRGALHVVETRMYGRSWGPECQDDLRQAVAWLRRMWQLRDEPLGDLPGWRDRVSAVSRALPELTAAEAARLRAAQSLVARLPSVPTQGDFAPKNLLVSGPDLVVLDWEFAHEAGIPGQDLLLLVALRQAPTPATALLTALAAGGGEPWLLEALAQVGVPPPLVAAVLVSAAADWARAEAVRNQPLGCQGTGTGYADLLRTLLATVGPPAPCN